MPSTATTNVTISTILDLIGPTAQSIGNDDRQPAFDSVLHDSPPSSSSLQSPQPPKRNDNDRPAPTAIRDDNSSAPKPRASDCSDEHSAENDASQGPDAATRADSEATNGEHSDSDHSAEMSDDVQQLIAQSLAGLPAATPSIARSDAVASPDEPAPGSGESASEEELAGSQGLDRAAKNATPRPQPNGNQTIAAIDEIATTPAENQLPEQPGGLLEITAKNKTASQPAEQSATVQARITDKATREGQGEAKDQSTDKSTEQLTDVKIGTGETAQPSRQKSSQASEAASAAPDTSTSSAQSFDATAAANTSATPIAAPQPPNAATLNQAQSSDPSSSNPSGAISGSGSRSRLPAQALAPATSAAGRRAAVEVDAVRLLTRVVRAFSAAQERDGEVRLRLSPPELGSLRLDIRVENGALTAHLQTETDSARTAIIDNLPALRERLAEQGVRIERFDVDLMQRQPGGMPDQPGGRQPETAEAPPRFVRPARSNGASAPQSIPASLTVGATGGLNVIV